jgi:small multidrug resistance pump
VLLAFKRRRYFVNPLMNPMVLLFFAIVCEISATAALKASEGLTRVGPSVLMVLGYAATFFFFALSIRHIPLGIAYAIWSGIGTAGAVMLGIMFWRETLDTPRIIGIALIITGVVVLNAFAKTSTG